MDEVDRLQKKYAVLLPKLNERDRRLVVAAEAQSVGFGGVSLLHKVTGMSRTTIGSGIKDLHTEQQSHGRIRKVGGGRKKKQDTDHTLLADLEEILDPETLGDPESPLRWTSKGLMELTKALQTKGHEVSHTLVRQLLVQSGYSLQANRKRYEGKQHPDRDKQFGYINTVAKEAIAQGNPVLSVDTKKKELVGNFKNNGKQWKKKRKPQEVNAYDFRSLAEGKAVPYGIYDIQKNEAVVNVGMSSDTPMFAVASLKVWWEEIGKKRYRDSAEIVITADCGGSNSNRARLWKWELQQLANEIQKTIKVCHFPPGTSKWNKIEHRLFCYISLHWRGKPLVTYETIVSLIGTTTTQKGLQVYAKLDQREYEKGIKISDEQMKQIALTGDAFHPEWNYTIHPKTE